MEIREASILRRYKKQNLGTQITFNYSANFILVQQYCAKR